MKKMDLLLHPVRMRIVQKLLLGKPLTIAQIAEMLGDIPQATLYRHMKLLLDQHHIEVVETRKVAGTEERFFMVKSDSLEISEDEVELTAPEDHVQHFSVYHANLFQHVTSYLTNNSPQDYKQEGFAYWNTPLHLTDTEFQELTQTIQASIEKAFQNEKTPDRSTRTFAGMFIPHKEK
ncbi:helix-turn-helix domain-containing protein [Paenibacillus sp. NPDC057886]|uniref:helix-turn-helix domain-containing protein n=1 Tax=Paenibacillus sp. NPDC057886 TaxID=3346270 RepID=UPI00369B40D9